MSRLVVLLPFVLAASAHAQDLDSLRAEIAQRAARLETASELHARAESTVVRARRVQLLSGLDSARVGPFNIVAPGPLLPRAEREFSAAWSAYQPLLGAAAGQLRPLTYLVRGMRHVDPYTLRVRLPDHVHVTLAVMPWQPLGTSPAADAISRVVVHALPANVRNWTRGLHFGRPTDWGVLYRSLVLASAAPAKRCYDGDIASCRLALALDPSGEQWSGWYSAEELRAFALGGSTTSSVQRQCATGITEACVLILRRRGGPPAPLPLGHRTALLELALELGGDGALERLMADPAAALPERLERAAGVGLDELTAQWHQRVLAGRPAARASLGTTALSVLITALISLLLARRSTRWRVG